MISQENTRVVVDDLLNIIDKAQIDYPEMSLSEMVGILESLKLELFIEQRE